MQVRVVNPTSIKNREIVGYIRKLTLKVDFQKALDSINWGYLLLMFRNMIFFFLIKMNQLDASMHIF